MVPEKDTIRLEGKSFTSACLQVWEDGDGRQAGLLLSLYFLLTTDEHREIFLSIFGKNLLT